MEKRNPVHLNVLKDFLTQQFDYINKLDNTLIKDKERFPHFTSNEYLHKLIFKNSLDIARLNMDLEFKILLNKTKNPFITSDFPVVRYNQLMESFDWNFSSYTGNGWIGMQMYIPLNENYTIVFYDNTTYRVGNKKEKFVEINDSDVEHLNLLQVINCNQNLYFNEKTNKNYIEKLISKREKIDYNHKGILKEYEDANNPNGIIVGITKPNIKSKLKISKIKIHSGAQNFKLTNEAVQFRKKAKQVYDHIQNKKK